MKLKLKKVFRILRTVLCWLCIALLLIVVISLVTAKIQGSYPSVFGHSIYRVSSGSMSPELEVGDVILGKSVSDPMDIKVGDIVTYKGSGELSGMLITHKVIVAPEEVDGVLTLQTKGIANEIPDSPISAERVVSVVVCEVEFLAAFYNFFFSPWGLLTVIALIILVFIDEVIAIIRNLTGNDLKTEKKDINEIIGRIKSEEVDNDTENESDEQ
ncbi:MAG: signal peptidase I [Clostridia bacterium]|nr:signal peptidase I [Clostridia bacterium]